MDNQRFQTEARHFNRPQNTDKNEDFTSGNKRVKRAVRRTVNYTLKFSVDKSKFRFKDSKSGSSLKFEDSEHTYSNDTKHSSNFKFEEDRTQRDSKYGNYSPSDIGDEISSRQKAKGKRKIGANVVNGELDNIAYSSENEGLQGANIERKTMWQGTRWGYEKGSRWRKNHAARVARRELKAKNKALIRENEEKLYQLKHGHPSFREKLRQKRIMMQRQMKAYTEKKVGVETAAKIEQLAIKAAKGIAAIIRAVLAYVGAPLLGIILILGLMFFMAFFISIAFMSLGTTTTMSYTAESSAIEQASCYYTKLEAELDKKIKDIPMSWEWAHIDEFRYYLDPIGHDAYQIMAYLNVKYPGFNLEDPLLWQQVQTEIDYIFDARYELILDEEVEERGDDESTYYYYILNVILHTKEQEPILLTELNRNPEEELVEWYGVLQETQGARQDYANPFGLYDWRGSVSSLYGWRVDPIGGRELQMHHGLDIAMPNGTPILAGLDGTVRYTDTDTIMGNYIILDADDDSGRTIKYGHCSSIDVAAGTQVKAGETVIGKVGSSGQSTGAHLHVETMENGQYLDPIYVLNYLPIGG